MQFILTGAHTVYVFVGKILPDVTTLARNVWHRPANLLWPVLYLSAHCHWRSEAAVLHKEKTTVENFDLL